MFIVRNSRFKIKHLKDMSPFWSGPIVLLNLVAMEKPPGYWTNTSKYFDILESLTTPLMTLIVLLGISIPTYISYKRRSSKGSLEDPIVPLVVGWIVLTYGGFFGSVYKYQWAYYLFMLGGAIMLFLLTWFYYGWFKILKRYFRENPKAFEATLSYFTLFCLLMCFIFVKNYFIKK